jgi:hypothetical protein
MQCRPRPPWRSSTSRANPISCRYNGVQDLALEVPVLGVLVLGLALEVLVLGLALEVLVLGLAPGVLVLGLARPGVRVRVPARGGLYRVRREAPTGITRMWHLHIARDVWRQPLCIRWALFWSPD